MKEAGSKRVGGQGDLEEAMGEKKSLARSDLGEGKEVFFKKSTPLQI